MGWPFVDTEPPDGSFVLRTIPGLSLAQCAVYLRDDAYAAQFRPINQAEGAMRRWFAPGGGIPMTWAYLFRSSELVLLFRQDDPTAVPCVTCGVAIGQRCVEPQPTADPPYRDVGPHPLRVVAAKRRAQRAAGQEPGDM